MCEENQAPTEHTATPAEFWDRLDKLDWYYSYAEGEAYWRGKEEYRKTKELADSDPALRRLWDQFYVYMFSNGGPRYNEKPARPEE